MYRGLNIQATLHHGGQLNTVCLPLGLSFDCTKALQELTLQLFHLQGHKATEVHIVNKTRILACIQAGILFYQENYRRKKKQEIEGYIRNACFTKVWSSTI